MIKRTLFASNSWSKTREKNKWLKSIWESVCHIKAPAWLHQRLHALWGHNQRLQATYVHRRRISFTLTWKHQRFLNQPRLLSLSLCFSIYDVNSKCIALCFLWPVTRFSGKVFAPEQRCLLNAFTCIDVTDAILSVSMEGQNCLSETHLWFDPRLTAWIYSALGKV